VSCNYWNHIPSNVVESSDVKVLWEFNIYTDRFLSVRHPDIVVIDKCEKMVKIIDVAVPLDSNVSTKEMEEIEKYKDLSLELSSLWKMKCEVVPLVIGSLYKYVGDLFSETQYKLLLYCRIVTANSSFRF